MAKKERVASNFLKTSFRVQGYNGQMRKFDGNQTKSFGNFDIVGYTRSNITSSIITLKKQKKNSYIVQLIHLQTDRTRKWFLLLQILFDKHSETMYRANINNHEIKKKNKENNDAIRNCQKLQ